MSEEQLFETGCPLGQTTANRIRVTPVEPSRQGWY